MRSLERVNIRTNVCTYVRTYVLTYIRTGQTLYPLHNFVVRGDNLYPLHNFVVRGDNKVANLNEEFICTHIRTLKPCCTKQ